MKKLLLIALFTLLAALSLTACQNSESTTAASTTTDSTPTTTVNEVLATAYNDPERFISLPTLSSLTVSDKEIQSELESYLAQVLDVVGREDYVAMDPNTAAILGDSVNIHYTGRAKDTSVTLSEATLAGMTNASDEAGYDLVLGSGSFIPGFEDQLIGAKIGDTVSVDVTFPDGYSEELSNVAVIFEVTVNALSRATVADKHVVAATVLYTLKDDTENEAIAAFLASHTVEIDLSDPSATFDDVFTSAMVKDALIGKSTFGTAEAELTLPAETASEYGYDHALTLSALFTIDQVIFYPTELSDDDVSYFTGGEYTDLASFRDYIYNYYKAYFAYNKALEEATFAEIPTDVYQALYDGYYDSWVANNVADASDMTEEDKTEADEYAAENATAEYKDRMLMAYLEKKLDYTLSEEVYQAFLQDNYNYYYQNYYFQLIYSGITDIDSFEAYMGEDYLRYQCSADEIIKLLGTKVSVGD